MNDEYAHIDAATLVKERICNLTALVDDIVENMQADYDTKTHLYTLMAAIRAMTWAHEQEVELLAKQ